MHNPFAYYSLHTNLDINVLYYPLTTTQIRNKLRMNYMNLSKVCKLKED